MFTEKELEYYENNWNKHKQERDAVEHGRTWKLLRDEWVWNDGRFGRYNSDYNCWKRQKKSKHQYRVKTPKKAKKRKPVVREHWRISESQPYANYWYTMPRHVRNAERRQYLINKTPYEVAYKIADEIYTGDIVRVFSGVETIVERYVEDGDIWFVMKNNYDDRERILDIDNIRMYPDSIKRIEYNSAEYNSKKLHYKEYCKNKSQDVY